MCKYIDLAVEASEEYFETSFFGWGSPSEFNIGHSLADQNWMAVNARGGAVKSFHFALSERIIETILENDILD